MTVAALLRVLLELDQQCVSPRPSPWGQAAELVAALADHAEPSLRDPSLLGDWRPVDLSPVGRRAPAELHQPTLDRVRDLPVARMVADAHAGLREAEGVGFVRPELASDLACHVLALAEALERSEKMTRR